MLITAAMCFTLAFSSCKKEPDLIITIDSSDITVNPTQGKDTIKFNSNKDWTLSITDVKAESSWIEVTPKSGKVGNAELYLDYQKNDTKAERSASIVITDGKTKKTITVKQGILAFNIDVKEKDIESIGGDFIVKVTGASDWTVENTFDWITATPATGTGDMDVKIDVKANSTKDPRTGTLKFVSNGETKTLTVKQKGGTEPQFYVNVVEKTVGYQAGTFTGRIYSNLDWVVENTPDWITVTPNKGTGNADLTFTYKANGVENKREGIINYTAGTIKSQTKIIQEPLPSPFLSLSMEKNIVSSTAGSFTISVNCNRDWTVEGVPAWMTITPNSGTNTSSVTINYTDNTTGSVRENTIKFTSAGLSANFVLKQYATSDSPIWLTENFFKRSVFIRFTASWCGYCPTLGKTVDELYQRNPQKLVPLAIHAEDSDASLRTNYASNFWKNKFDVKMEGYPTGVVDFRGALVGASGVSIANWEKLMAESDQFFPAQTGIAIQTKLSGRDLSVDVTIQSKVVEKFKISVVVTENNIPGPQNGAADGYIHNYVTRDFLTSVYGDVLDITDQTKEWKKNYSYTIPSRFKAENCNVVVFVERAYGSSIEHKETVPSVNYALVRKATHFLDNIAITKVGSNTNVVYK